MEYYSSLKKIYNHHICKTTASLRFIVLSIVLSNSIKYNIKSHNLIKKITSSLAKSN